MCFLETKSEIVVPIKIASRTLGVIDVESDQANAFGSEDRVLLERVAQLLARFLTSKGKYLVRKAREAKESGLKTREEKHAPASEKMQSTRRAAAGETSRP
jgi:hypothetical protein